MRSLSKAQREELLGQAGLPVRIPTEQALAMKADLSLPWNKLRVISRQVTIMLIDVGVQEIHYTRMMCMDSQMDERPECDVCERKEAAGNGK